MPSTSVFMLNGRVGAPAFLGLKTSQTYYGPDPRGESGSMNCTKVGIWGQKNDFCLLLQPGYNLTWEYNFSSQFQSFFIYLFIFFKCSTEDDLKILTKKWVIPAHHPLLLKCTVVNFEVFSCIAQSFSLCIRTTKVTTVPSTCHDRSSIIDDLPCVCLYQHQVRHW